MCRKFDSGKPNASQVVSIVGRTKLTTGQAVLATVSAEALDEMIKRGHAIREPEIRCILDFGHNGKTDSVTGGIRVLRCDVQAHKGSNYVELVAESINDEGVLLFVESDAWMVEDRTLTAGTGAEILAHIEQPQWKRHWHAATLQPGSQLISTTTAIRHVEGSGPSLFSPFAKHRYEPRIIREDAISLSADGKVLTL